MPHETGGSDMRDRHIHKDDPRDRDVRERDPYEEHEREAREMPERHSTREKPRLPFDDERDMDIQAGYR